MKQAERVLALKVCISKDDADGRIRHFPPLGSRESQPCTSAEANARLAERNENQQLRARGHDTALLQKRGVLVYCNARRGLARLS
jgi:hypothetical protein